MSVSSDSFPRKRVAPRHHVLVLVPEVEHIAQQVDGTRLLLDTVEESHQPPFLHPLVSNGPRTKVGVAKEIDWFHINEE
jgi:hypothetical protein